MVALISLYILQLFFVLIVFTDGSFTSKKQLFLSLIPYAWVPLAVITGVKYLIKWYTELE